MIHVTYTLPPIHVTRVAWLMEMGWVCCCSVLQCVTCGDCVVAVCCSVLQCVEVTLLSEIYATYSDIHVTSNRASNYNNTITTCNTLQHTATTHSPHTSNRASNYNTLRSTQLQHTTQHASSTSQHILIQNTTHGTWLIDEYPEVYVTWLTREYPEVYVTYATGSATATHIYMWHIYICATPCMWHDSWTYVRYTLIYAAESATATHVDETHIYMWNAMFACDMTRWHMCDIL